ncbi:MAG: thioredoxin family protein [Alphaproteobacteria bacterium]|nr:thioredoxin family protein [Alphaproteobacteria bacterium]
MAARVSADTAASDWDKHEFARARLVSAVAATGDLAELRLGLQIRLEPGWWTYWRSPGDAGLPAQVDWSGSENLAEASLLWPAPERHTLLGIETFGYQGEVLLPVLARPKKPGEPVRLRAAVDYLVCEKICVPAHAELAVDLPAGSPVASSFVDLVDRWRAKVPGDGRAAGLAVERVSLLRDGAGASLAVRVAAREPLKAPDLIVEGPAGLRFAKPRMISAADGAILVSAIAMDKVAPDVVLADGVTLTLLDSTRAAEVKAPVVPGSAADLGGNGDLAVLGGVLLVALLGGLILNLMPCVLPVLSLKMMSVVGHGGGDRGAVRLGFIAAAAGIIASFLLLAGGAIALRSAGLAVGWGIQFQQPGFIAAMAAILVLFACNLMGWFEIGGPRWAFDAAEGHAASHGMLGHFLTGALATLLATPCSAPFLGTAVGFALSRGAPEIVAVFLALGLGLSLPYLLIAAFPGLATRLPRPGRWMLHLRRALGLALALTAAWLVAVLASQRGMLAAAIVAALLVALALGFAFARHLPGAIRRAAPAAVGAYVIATVAIAMALPATASRDAAMAAKDDHWRGFDEAAIPALVAEGRVVFVDVTADWCITCQANKTLVLKRGAVAERLGGGEIVSMRADWTRPDPVIGRYLTKFGRYGIPFNVIYGPAAPQGIALPELLTSEAVLTALDQAQAPARPVAKRP